MIATAIMGVMFAAIFALQSSVTRSVVTTTQQLERMFHARNFFIESAAESGDAETSEKEAFTRNKKITRPSTELLYKKSKLKSHEPFDEFVHDMYKQQVTISWHDGKRKRQDMLVGYVYQPKKAKQGAEKPADDSKKASSPKQPEAPKSPTSDSPPTSTTTVTTEKPGAAQ